MDRLELVVGCNPCLRLGSFGVNNLYYIWATGGNSWYIWNYWRLFPKLLIYLDHLDMKVGTLKSV